MKRTSFLPIVAWLACFVLQGPIAESQEGRSEKAAASSSSPTVLVRVNGHPITTADWQFFVETRKLADEDISQHRDDIIERLIERQLLRTFLAERKMAADPKRLDELVNQLKLRVKNRNQDFAQELTKAGFTEESLRRELSLPLDWDAYVRSQVTDAKLRETWDKRRSEFDGTEVVAAHIARKGEDLDREEKLLKQVRAEIVSGKSSFADAARKHSQAPSATDGGPLGRFGFRGKQPPPFPQVAFALKVGEVSEPFRSPFGMHLLTVTQRIDGQLSLEDARPDIFKQLSTEMQRDVLRQQRDKAKIERLAEK